MAEAPPMKFPRTRHLLDTGSATRDDLVFDIAEVNKHFLDTTIICEEKVDGSNLGISFDRDWNLQAQKRIHWVTGASEQQYCKLDAWLYKHKASLIQALGQDYILFGEWMFAQHTVVYDQLPDWFLAFDIYDKQKECFLSRSMMLKKLHPTDIRMVRCITRGVYSSLEELENLLESEFSAYSSNSHVEGIYLRVDCEGESKARAKLVRSSFVQAVNSSSHWSKNSIKSNTVRADLWMPTCEEHDDGDGNVEGTGEPDDAFLWDLGCRILHNQELKFSVLEGGPRTKSCPSRLHRLELMTTNDIEQEDADFLLVRIGWAPFTTRKGLRILWPSAQKLRNKYGLPACNFVDEQDEDLRTILTPYFMHYDGRQSSSQGFQMHSESIIDHVQYVLILVSQCHVDMMLKQESGSAIDEYNNTIMDLLETLRVADFPDTLGISWSALESHRLMTMARNFGRLGQFQDCVEAALEASRVNPGVALAHNLCAKGYYQMGNFDEALIAFKNTRAIVLAAKEDKGEKHRRPNRALDFLNNLCRQSSQLADIERGILVCKEKVFSFNSVNISNSSTSSLIDAQKSYPSTAYLPFSPNRLDVQVCTSVENYLINSKVVVSEKLDGGNCCIHKGRTYARSHAHETTKPWFSAVKALAAAICARVPDNLVLFGENMEAIHSIRYDRLTHPFYLFAVLDTISGNWLSWTKVQAIATALNLATAPTLFEGMFTSLARMKDWMDEKIAEPSALGLTCPREGFVVRVHCSFHSSDFGTSIAKYVRPGHVQTTEDFERNWEKSKWNLKDANPN